MGDPVNDSVEFARSGNGFVEFVSVLAGSLSDRISWENTELDDYLLACCSWALDSVDYAKQEDALAPSEVTWQFLAGMLSAGTVYE